MQKNLFRIILALLVLSSVFIFLKKINSNNPQETDRSVSEEVVYENRLPDDFHDFYNQFHTDSIFQMSRIVFPLKGIAQSDDTTKVIENISWLEDEWILHRPFDDQGGTFEREFINTANIITEKISANGGLFALEKRYAKLGGKWHLIFYQELLMLG